MNTTSDTKSATPEQIQGRITFLHYISDFLNQFTGTAEKLELNQMAYFLSMAALEASDQLARLQKQTGPQTPEGEVSAA